VVGEAVSVTVGAGAVPAADFAIDVASLLASVLEVTCALMAGFAAVAVAVPAAGLEESSPQAARANSAVHPITQCAKRGASPAIKPAWRLVNFIENLLESAPVSCAPNPKMDCGPRPQSRRVVM
jgi:hypothetical protein